jgi:hypothetical protein
MLSKIDKKKLKKLKAGSTVKIENGTHYVAHSVDGETFQKLRDPSKMQKVDLVRIVERIQDVLWGLYDGEIDPEGTTTGADAVDSIYEILGAYNMNPIEIDPDFKPLKETSNGD